MRPGQINVMHNKNHGTRLSCAVTCQTIELNQWGKQSTQRDASNKLIKEKRFKQWQSQE